MTPHPCALQRIPSSLSYYYAHFVVIQCQQNTYWNVLQFFSSLFHFLTMTLSYNSSSKILEQSLNPTHSALARLLFCSSISLCSPSFSTASTMPHSLLYQTRKSPSLPDTDNYSAYTFLSLYLQTSHTPPQTYPAEALRIIGPCAKTHVKTGHSPCRLTQNK